MTDVYRQLAEKLDNLPNGYPATESGIEIRILQKIFEPDEAAMAGKMRLLPETAQDIAGRLDKSLDEMQPILDSMVAKGQIGSAKMKGEQRYMLVPFVVGIFEFQLDRMDKELAQMVEEYAPNLIPALGGHQPTVMKVLPVNVNIDGKHEVHPYEDIRRIMDSAKSFRVMECICRKEQALQGHPCTHSTEVCLGFSNSEDAFDRYPRGRLISRDEALAILKQSEEEGLVHCTYNVQRGQMFVCNCCSCCCGILRGMTRFGAPHLLAGSNYFAEIDQDTCSVCGICAEERCPMNAIVEEDGSYTVRPEQCIGCGACSTGCPTESINMIRKPESLQEQPPGNIVEWFMQRSANRGVQIRLD